MQITIIILIIITVIIIRGIKQHINGDTSFSERNIFWFECVCTK